MKPHDILLQGLLWKKLKRASALLTLQTLNALKSAGASEAGNTSRNTSSGQGQQLHNRDLLLLVSHNMNYGMSIRKVGVVMLFAIVLASVNKGEVPPHVSRGSSRDVLCVTRPCGAALRRSRLRRLMSCCCFSSATGSSCFCRFKLLHMLLYRRNRQCY